MNTGRCSLARSAACWSCCLARSAACCPARCDCRIACWLAWKFACRACCIARWLACRACCIARWWACCSGFITAASPPSGSAHQVRVGGRSSDTRRPTMSAMTGDGFALSEEQEEFRKIARAFAEEVIGPRAAEIDETDEFPWDLHKAMVAQGFLGIGLPEELGGAGGGPLDVCILIEELARVSGGVSVIPLVNRLAAIPILLAGSEAQKRAVVEGLVSGEHQYSYCLTEPGSGSDAAAMASRAVPDGSGWRLTGQKRFITNAGISDRYVYFAVTNPEGEECHNITAFLGPG